MITKKELGESGHIIDMMEVVLRGDNKQDATMLRSYCALDLDHLERECADCAYTNYGCDCHNKKID